MRGGNEPCCEDILGRRSWPSAGRAGRGEDAATASVPGMHRFVNDGLLGAEGGSLAVGRDQGISDAPVSTSAQHPRVTKLGCSLDGARRSCRAWRHRRPIAGADHGLHVRETRRPARRTPRRNGVEWGSMLSEERMKNTPRNKKPQNKNHATRLVTPRVSDKPV